SGRGSVPRGSGAIVREREGGLPFRAARRPPSRRGWRRSTRDDAPDVIGEQQGRGIVRARLLSQATLRNIRQNLFFAFIYNSLGVPVAAGILYPRFGILLSPIFAAAAMSVSSVSVVVNSLRLRLLDLEDRL
ncbi:MAG TPA: hypothetical protein VKM72_13645, partial [Thermoanaerobaculia bacterium]|nr:hypothetical protein [Thermoanaerobaculia bacterium]